LLISNATLGRIHFKLHYDDLNEESRGAVWKNFIEKVLQKGRSTISQEDIAKLAKKPLNGRQVNSINYPKLSNILILGY
jgi:hypothetical protein